MIRVYQLHGFVVETRIYASAKVDLAMLQCLLHGFVVETVQIPAIREKYPHLKRGGGVFSQLCGC